MTSEMGENRQESCTSDSAEKKTRKKKRYLLGIEKVLLKGLRNDTQSVFRERERKKR